jgi:hypothetical protein
MHFLPIIQDVLTGNVKSGGSISSCLEWIIEVGYLSGGTILRCAGHLEAST